MVDLGLYNFVKSNLALGKSKADISDVLIKGGNNQTVIDEIFNAIDNNLAPLTASQNTSQSITVPQSQVATQNILNSNNRPIIITVVCLYLLIATADSILQTISLVASVASSTNAHMNYGYTGISFLIQIVGLIAVAGYWMMRKWGVYLYTLAFVSSFTLFLAEFYQFSLTNFVSPAISYIVPLGIVVVGYYYLNLMA